MKDSSVRTLLNYNPENAPKGYWSERFKMSVHGPVIIGGRWTPLASIPWC